MTLPDYFWVRLQLLSIASNQPSHLNRLEVNNNSEDLSHLQEHGREVPLGNRGLQILVYVDHLSYASQQVLEESHNHWCEIGEQLNFLHSEDRQVLERVKADHEDIRAIAYRPRRIEQVVVEATVKVSPLQERDLCEPKFDYALKTISRICSVFVGLSSLEEGCPVVCRQILVGWVEKRAQVILELLRWDLFLMKFYLSSVLENIVVRPRSFHLITASLCTQVRE